VQGSTRWLNWAPDRWSTEDQSPLPRVRRDSARSERIAPRSQEGWASAPAATAVIRPEQSRARPTCCSRSPRRASAYASPSAASSSLTCPGWRRSPGRPSVGCLPQLGAEGIAVKRAGEAELRHVARAHRRARDTGEHGAAIGGAENRAAGPGSGEASSGPSIHHASRLTTVNEVALKPVGSGPPVVRRQAQGRGRRGTRRGGDDSGGGSGPR